jgi:hypothetical protein
MYIGGAPTHGHHCTFLGTRWANYVILSTSKLPTVKLYASLITLTKPNTTWPSPDTCGGPLTLRGTVRMGSNEVNIVSDFLSFRKYMAFNLFADIDT